MTDTAASHAIVVHTLLAIAALFGGSFVLLAVFRARRALLVRAATLLVVMLVTLAAASGGPLVFALFVLLLVALALSELWPVLDAAGTPPYRHSGSLAAGVLVAAAFWRGSAALAPAAAVSTAALLCRGFLSGDRTLAIHRVAATLLGVGYLGMLGAFLVLLRTDVGLGAVVFFIAVIQLADVSAFFGGSAVGRRALAPSLSPGKTWEGVLAGVLGGMVAALVFRFALPELSTVAAVISGAVLALTGLAGDLVASGFKREAGVKDFGGVLPGHGGILDRFDGCFMAAPVAWLLFRPWSLS